MCYVADLNKVAIQLIIMWVFTCSMMPTNKWLTVYWDRSNCDGTAFKHWKKEGKKITLGVIAWFLWCLWLFLQKLKPIAVSMCSVRRSARQFSLENYVFAAETANKALLLSAGYVYVHTVNATVIALTPSPNYLLCIETYFLIQRCQFTSVFFVWHTEHI